MTGRKRVAFLCRYYPLSFELKGSDPWNDVGLPRTQKREPIAVKFNMLTYFISVVTNSKLRSVRQNTNSESFKIGYDFDQIFLKCSS